MLKRQVLKLLSFCVIGLVVISTIAQVAPKRTVNKSTEGNKKCLLDTNMLDSIVSTQNEIQRILKKEMYR